MNEKHNLVDLLKSYFSPKSKNNKNQSELYDWYDRLDLDSKRSIEEIYEIQDRVKNRLFENIGSERKVIFSIRKMRIPMAAAVLLALSISGFYWYQHKEKEVSNQLLSQIVPQRDAAIIQFQNGETINIDKLGVHEKVLVGDIEITKDEFGEISYKDVHTGQLHVQRNTLIVPKYSTYSIILTDGTKVTLNAESKLTYPSSFEEGARIVELEGEGYFEVSKRHDKAPFIVKSAAQQVKVLGTKFNVKISNQSSETRTSLIEGSVAVENAQNSKIILKPNQQAINDKESINIVKMDTDQVLSWMQNQFYFNGENSTEVLQDIASWYDIEIECIKNPQYKGVIPRSLSLDKFIELLKYADMNVKAVMGKGSKVKLIIT